MNYYTIAPPSTLAQYVRFFWVLEGNFNGSSFVYRSLADGCTELLFHYYGTFQDLHNNETSPPALIHAQSSKHNRFSTKAPFGIFGVYLYPFALPALFNIPCCALTNQMPSLDSVLGTQGSELEERVMLAADNPARLKILTTFFEGLLVKNKSKDPTFQRAVLYAINSKGAVSVKQLANEFCLSERQFERKFKEYSGFNPKMYLRITRFHYAIEEHKNNFKTLSELAHLCGYYDQSHFIHDFREFSGYHPSHYFSSLRTDESLVE
jgi:AraC-like DNA-binding protein